MRLGAAAIATVLAVNSVQPVTAAVPHALWVTAWEAPLNTVFASSPGSGPSGTTVRNIARVWTAGAQIRVRFSNALDQTTPLVIGAATVGIVQNAPSPALATESLRTITFGGQRSATLLAGAQSLVSDPVAFPVRAQEDIAISIFLPAAKEPGAATADYNTSYQAPPGAGDQTRDTSGVPFIIGSDATYALTGVDVLGTGAAGVIIGLGSSTFQGSNAIPNGHDRVLELMAARGTSLPLGSQRPVVSAGIGGDTLHAGLTRAQRDVFSQSGVTGMVVYDINDLAQGRTAGQVEADYATLVRQAHQRHIIVFCSTWAPESTDFTHETERHALNQWLLTSSPCDGVVDWDAVLRSPLYPDTYNPLYFSDSIHPNALGHAAMAAAVPDSWFTQTLR